VIATEEYVVLVDADDKEIGLAEKLSAHKRSLLHRAFSVFLFQNTTEAESEPELLLQQRALNKYHSPGLWTNTCCSHPRMQEDVLEAGQRRLQEELNIHIRTPLKHLGYFRYHAHFPNSLTENEIDHVLLGSIPSTTHIVPNPEEVHAYRWATITQLEDEVAAHPEQFTPWLAQALQVVKQHLPSFIT
jgi:isopentenyl-diphosphate delta-isomerase